MVIMCFALVWYSLVSFDLFWFGSGQFWFDFVWICFVLFGLALFGLDMFCFVWFYFVLLCFGFMGLNFVQFDLLLCFFNYCDISFSMCCHVDSLIFTLGLVIVDILNLVPIITPRVAYSTTLKIPPELVNEDNYWQYCTIGKQTPHHHPPPS